MATHLTSVRPQMDSHVRNRRALPALTGIRFFAAFYVVLFHGLPWLLRHFRIPLPLETFLSNGYLAVGLFFLLSGFILAYTYEGQIDGTPNRLRFWEARFARIYPVYLLSLILAYWFERGLRWGTRLAVLGMVQAWNPRTPELAGAWNYPAWSLSVEAFFYLCFPFVLPWMSRKSNRSLSWMITVLLMFCVLAHTPVQGLGKWDQTYLIVRVLPLPILRIPEFLLGMAIGLKHLRNEGIGKNVSHPLRVYPAVFCIFAALSLPLGEWVSLVMVPFAVLVYELALGSIWLARILSTRIMVLLGGASYAVYLLQFPVRSWTRVLFSHFPERIAHLSAPLTPLILVLVSMFVFQFFETPSREALRRWFPRRKQRPVDLPSTEATDNNS
jgi:peptidoglycan/LPS O-acetylase OafA/YrhL